jgi:FtsP/CotA-like multicopper oxidase with cupredoxin domain
MNNLSRRQFIGAAVAAGTSPALSRAASAAVPPFNHLVADTSILDVNGKAAKVFRLSGPNGKPGLSLAPNEAFRVELVNRLNTSTIIHWHGQLPPWMQDGFPWPQTPPIGAGGISTYDYQPIAGTYWMHSHDGFQEQSLMTAPLIVHDAAELAEDRQEIVLMLHDFSFRSGAEILAGLTGKSLADVNYMAHRSENVPAPAMNMTEPASDNQAMSQMPMGSMAMMSGTMSGMKMTPGTMDLNDVHYDAFLANDRTLDDPEIVRVARSGRLRLRIINGASASQFWIDLGALEGRVVAADGHGVIPVPGRRFPISMAQRLDILIDVPSEGGAFPIVAQLEGTRRRTGIVLATSGAPITRITQASETIAGPVDNSLEVKLTARHPLAPRAPDLRHRIVLSGSMQPYAWALNGEYWPKIGPIMLTKGQRVEIDLVNHSMMAHPIHLHGHTFQVIAVNGRPINGAVRDTVVVTPMGSVRFAFDANNPGRWALHCHNLYHMMTGMMTEFRYRGIMV